MKNIIEPEISSLNYQNKEKRISGKINNEINEEEDDNNL